MKLCFLKNKPCRSFVIFAMCILIYILFYNLTKNSLNETSLQIGINERILEKRHYSSTYEISQLPNITVPDVNCGRLFENSDFEMQRALSRMKQQPMSAIQNSDDFNFEDINCTHFLLNRSYVLHYLSKEELEFPLAFSLVIYKDLAQFERLFRAIYRPQNAYCIHVDLKSPPSIHRGVNRFAGCFPANNVIVISHPVDVRWGEYSVLEADLLCFRALLKRFKDWKYLINLTGQEFPLRTHRELVRILSILNGANSVEGTFRRRNVNRVPREKLAFPLTWYKGSLHVIASREFVNFMFSNSHAIKINEVLKEAYMADEQFFATLNHNPHLGTPGAYLGSAETDQRAYHFIARLKNWGDPPFNYPCQSARWVRQICIWGVRDLPFIARRFELFVNKFYSDFQPLALDCMEQRFWERTRRDYQASNLDLDEAFYRALAIVRNHQ